MTLSTGAANIPGHFADWRTAKLLWVCTSSPAVWSSVTSQSRTFWLASEPLTCGVAEMVRTLAIARSAEKPGADVGCGAGVISAQPAIRNAAATVIGSARYLNINPPRFGDATMHGNPAGVSPPRPLSHPGCCQAEERGTG